MNILSRITRPGVRGHVANVRKGARKGGEEPSKTEEKGQAKKKNWR